MSLNNFDRKKGALALASGKVFRGRLFGADPSVEPEKGGEVVFNTSMTGYQEILTDPSYQGQIVVMTPAHIGNTGVNSIDVESRRVYLSGFVVQELSGLVSNQRAENDLEKYLIQAGVPGITDIDTRALTRHLRSAGATGGLIADGNLSDEKLIALAKTVPSLEGKDLVKEVTSKEPYKWTEGSGEWESWSAGGNVKPPQGGTKKHVVVVDYGVKRNILRCLVDMGVDVTVAPAQASPEEIMGLKPDGILFSNGPGDPSAVSYAIASIKKLIEKADGLKKGGSKPPAMFGICLGHQLLGLALGGKTYKLKFGHHGANHPIKDTETDQVSITTQNHGFSLESKRADDGSWTFSGNDQVKVTHVNLNDFSVQGIRHKTLPIFSVQYHPEASAGPHDGRYLFANFMEAVFSGAN